jgi:peptidoglycan/LPS O-acetylase OafA/YrhL
MTTNDRDRLGELDVLRGFAAVAVVLFHYTVRYAQLYGYPSAPDIVLTHGYLGVEFFFCISGFVIFMTLDRTRRPMDFVVSRASRLWPAYIAAMLLTYSAVHLFGLQGRATSLTQALVNLTMFQELLRVPHVDPAYWSLQVELIFYCWMFLAYVTGMLTHIRALLCLGLVPPLVYWLARRYFGHELSSLAGTFLLVSYIPYFAIGIAAYNLRSRREHPYRDLLLMLAAIAVTAICLPLADCAIAVIAVLVFCAIARGHLSWIARGPLVFFGTISYTLYLVHQNIGYIVIRTAMEHGVPTDFAILIAVGCSICLAAALSWSIEKPARGWLRNVYARHRKTRDAAARPMRVPAAGL